MTRTDQDSPLQHRQIPKKDRNQPTLLYREEARALLNSLKHLKKLMNHLQPEEKKWVYRAKQEVNRWIYRIRLILRVRP